MKALDKPFDRSVLKMGTLSERKHKLDLGRIMELSGVDIEDSGLEVAGRRIASARKKGSSVVLMMGAHVIRAGVQRFILDLVKRGYISCVAVNGACLVHDYEFALMGATTECVETYIRDGRFGFWKELSVLNDVVMEGHEQGYGIGHSVGKFMDEASLPHGEISLLAGCYRAGVPVTCHVGIGCDILHQFSNFSGEAFGGASYRDFLTFAGVLSGLEGGVLMNFGSAVMAPEVYLKALSMVRNAAVSKGEEIRHFTTLVCDLLNLPEDIGNLPHPGDAAYYFRPWKTMLVRTVRDGGESFYVRGDHRRTLPQLWNAVNLTRKIY